MLRQPRHCSSALRSQVRWFGHLVRLPSGCLLVEVFGLVHLGRPGQTQDKTEGPSLSSYTGTPRCSPRRASGSSGERIIWVSLLSLLPRDPDRIAFLCYWNVYCSCEEFAWFSCLKTCVNKLNNDVCNITILSKVILLHCILACWQTAHFHTAHNN